MAKISQQPLFLPDPFFPEGREIDRLAVELLRLTAALGSLLHPHTSAGAAKLVSIADAFYANRAEGLGATPAGIEAALCGRGEGEGSPGPAAGAAHVRAALAADRHLADGGDLAGIFPLLHREFMEGVGPFRTNPSPPGELRAQDDGPVPASAVGGALELAGKAYGAETGLVRRVAALPAIFHRIAYLRPFPDGNPRVALLSLRPLLGWAGVAGGGLWSPPRAIARGGERFAELMEGASAPRWGELDGRGRLSQGGLNALCEWMLAAFRDEAAFMVALLDRDGMLARLKAYAAWREGIGELERGSFTLLREACLRGGYPRGEAGRVTGRPERSARRALHALTAYGLLESDGEKTQVRMGFPVKAAPWLFPGLFPEAVEAAL